MPRLLRAFSRADPLALLARRYIRRPE